jgi:hypothetical protein
MIQVCDPIKQIHGSTVFASIIKIVAYVCMLWLWATIVERTSPLIDAGILILSAPPALYLFWRYPEYGLITLLFFGSGFLAPNIIDIRLPLLGGFDARDILLLSLLLMSFFKSLSRYELRIPLWPVGGLLLVFLILMVFSLFNALFLEHVSGNWALSDARILFFYTTFFITGWTINNKQSLYTLVIGSFVIADMVAAIILIQQALGPHNLLLSSMSDSSWRVWEAAGATRVVPPGIIFMYFMMLISIGMTFFWRLAWNVKTLLIANTVFLCLGLIFTFTRSAWVAAGLALLVMLIVAFPDYRPYLFRSVVLIGSSILLLVGGLNLFVERLSLENETALGILDRFVSIFTLEDTLETNSLQWRYFEIQEATKAIQASPYIGVGLGNSYRNLTPFQGEARGLWTEGDISYVRIDRFTRYVHSSYYAIAVKMGVPALIILLAFCITAILKSVDLHQSLPESMARGIALPIGAGLVGLLQWSFIHAHLILAASTIAIGLLIGLLASIQYIYISQPQNPRSRQILD